MSNETYPLAGDTVPAPREGEGASSEPVPYYPDGSPREEASETGETQQTEAEESQAAPATAPVETQNVPLPADSNLKPVGFSEDVSARADGAGSTPVEAHPASPTGEGAPATAGVLNPDPNQNLMTPPENQDQHVARLEAERDAAPTTSNETPEEHVARLEAELAALRATAVGTPVAEAMNGADPNAREARPETYQVQGNDTLFTLSERFYGTPDKALDLMRHNSNVWGPHPDTVPVGRVIELPDL